MKKSRFLNPGSFDFVESFFFSENSSILCFVENS
jgi:hypothetical protein